MFLFAISSFSFTFVFSISLRVFMWNASAADRVMVTWCTVNLDHVVTVDGSPFKSRDHMSRDQQSFPALHVVLYLLHDFSSTSDFKSS